MSGYVLALQSILPNLPYKVSPNSVMQSLAGWLCAVQSLEIWVLHKADQIRGKEAMFVTIAGDQLIKDGSIKGCFAYEVREHDTFRNLVRKVGVSAKIMKKINPQLREAHYKVKPGQTINVPIDLEFAGSLLLLPAKCQVAS